MSVEEGDSSVCTPDLRYHWRRHWAAILHAEATISGELVKTIKTLSFVLPSVGSSPCDRIAY